jgi:DNA-binding transcriptional MerR regulator
MVSVGGGAGTRELKKQWMTIGELGRHSGVGVETVRYYQRLGLLSVPAARGLRTHRRYGAESVAELAFVRRCKALGFRLKEIAFLVQVRRTAGSSCTKVHEELAELRAYLEAKQQQLETQLGSVRSMLEACSGGQPINKCRTFARLERGSSSPTRQSSRPTP